MPFTFAHPAAVLPFHACFRRYISLTGLVVGSMSPDFEYFLHGKPHMVWGHTFAGFFFYNFPLVLLVSWLFHRVLKQPLLAHLPAPLDRWAAPMAASRWTIRSVRSFTIFFLSAIVGMWTHVIWDHFTHQHGQFVLAWPVLQQMITIGGWQAPFYKIAQHASTLLGFLTIAFYLFRHRNRGPAAPGMLRSNRKKLLFWLGTGTLFPFILLICLYLGGAEWPQIGTEYGTLVVSGIDSLLISLLLVSLWDLSLGRLFCFSRQTK